MLRAGLIANSLAIAAYFFFTAIGWGELRDNGLAVPAMGVHSLATGIYYCVVVATTLGFGDVLPFGACRAVLVWQVILNIILVALWLSSLTSPQREWAIPEGTEDQ